MVMFSFSSIVSIILFPFLYFNFGKGLMVFSQIKSLPQV